MHSILRFAKTAYVESQNLKPFLGEYTNPDDFISRMVKRGELIRLKNGFFLIAEKIEEAPSRTSKLLICCTAHHTLVSSGLSPFIK